MPLKNMTTKFKKWWRGKPLPLNSLIVAKNLGIEIHNYNTPPLIARLINPLFRFWLRRWPILLPIIVAAAVALFIHFDSKATSKTKEKEQHKITNAHIEAI